MLKHLPHKVDAVKSGQLALNAAYDEAKETEKASETEEQKEAERAAKFTELREEAPDLADLVTEETISLEANDALLIFARSATIFESTIHQLFGKG